MKKSEKAVALAKDVLKYLRYMNVRDGVAYCYGRLPDSIKDDCPGKEEAQKHIAGLTKNCKVCALGACFLSYIRLFDKVALRDISPSKPEFSTFSAGESVDVDYYDIVGQLNKIFSEKQMVLIESAFEQHCVQFAYDIDQDDIEAAEIFGQKYAEPKKRLRAIMQNIVRNNGVFKPPKLLKEASMSCCSN